MNTPTPNHRCVEQLAFVLLGEPEDRRLELLSKVLNEIAKYGKRSGWSVQSTTSFVQSFGDECMAAMTRQQAGIKLQ